MQEEPDTSMLIKNHTPLSTLPWSGSSALPPASLQIVPSPTHPQSFPKQPPHPPHFLSSGHIHLWPSSSIPPSFSETPFLPTRSLCPRMCSALGQPSTTPQFPPAQAGGPGGSAWSEPTAAHHPAPRSLLAITPSPLPGSLEAPRIRMRTCTLPWKVPGAGQGHRDKKAIPFPAGGNRTCEVVP